MHAGFKELISALSPDDKAVPTLKEIIARAEELHREQQALLKDLRILQALERKAGPRPLKHPDGKLTEEGLKHLHAGFDAGKSPSSLAKSLDITVPAVLYRQKAWKTQRARRTRK